MPQAIPVKVGDPIWAVDTPALLLDLDAFERNLAAMAAFARAAGVALRPHAKSHKCPEIARRQIAAGATGICVQKVSEAAAFVDAGIGDILICNEVVGPRKIGALVELAGRARVAACVDHLDNVRAIAAAAGRAGVQVRLLVEVDVGQGRCGVPPGEATLALAAAVVAEPALEFGGIHAYHGGAQHIRSAAERSTASRAAVDQAAAAVAALRAAGIACPTVTGGGTGTFMHEADSRVYTEVQPGSYIFMDVDYGRNQWQGELRFAQSLFVVAG